MPKYLRWISLSFIVVLLDQGSKWFVSKHLAEHKAVVVNRFFNWYLDYNQGAAFSLFSSASGWQRWMLSGFSTLVSLILLFMLKNADENDASTCAGLALILGGAVGNLIDRVYPGRVVDFIQWHVGTYYWPTFNIADSAVCIGAVLFIWGMRHD